MRSLTNVTLVKPDIVASDASCAPEIILDKVVVLKCWSKAAKIELNGLFQFW